MGHRTSIELQTARQLTTGPEIALLRAAYAHNSTPVMRARLATLMTHADDFDGVVALLHGQASLSIGQELMLASALLTRKSTGDDAEAARATERALAAAAAPHERSIVLAMRGKIERRRGAIDAARTTLTEALTLNAANMDACRRLMAIELETGNAARLLALAKQLTERGAHYTSLLVTHLLAHARLGNMAEARQIVGAHFRNAERLAAPPGWDSIDSFNRALADELLAHPGKRYERYGSASELSWRIDAPHNHGTPLVGQLLGQIHAAIEAHLARIADADHPWTKARPAKAVLHSSCVITEEAGYEAWHAHPHAWLSGAYYVRVPEAIATATDERGCIAFGLPEDLAGDNAAADYGVEVIRPEAGQLLMFPSHNHHRTFPHGMAEPRICVSFDLRPA